MSIKQILHGLFCIIFLSTPFNTALTQGLKLSPFRSYYLHANALYTTNNDSRLRNDVPMVNTTSIVAIPSFAWGRNIQSIIDNGFFALEKNSAFYIYAQQKQNFLSVGIIGDVDIQSFQNDVIRKHEATIDKKVEAYAQCIKLQASSFEPILLGYEATDEIDALIAKLICNLPTYAFFTADGTKHAVWLVNNDNDIKQVSQLFSQVDHCYILDGHHRAAALSKVYSELQHRQSKNPFEGLNIEQFNHCHVALFPHHQIHIFAYNRILKNISQVSNDDFLAMLKNHFIIESISSSDASPNAPHKISMYFDQKWFRLTPTSDYFQSASKNPVDSLDISLINNSLIKPLAKMCKVSTDQILEYVNYTVQIPEFEAKCNALKAKAAFVFYPIGIETLMAVAQTGATFPEKSTWIEPKVNI
jgi:uncharacterized protein (DUF1015 family)